MQQDPSIPPHAFPPPQPKKSLWPLMIIIILGVFGFCAILMAAVLFPVFAQARLSARKEALMTTAKQTATSLMIYTVDSDGVLPRADQWIDLTRVANPDHTEEKFQMQDGDHQSIKGSYFHALNSGLQNINELPNPNSTAMTFWSTKAEKNAHDKLESLQWSKGARSYTIVSQADGSARTVLAGNKLGPDPANGPLKGP